MEELATLRAETARLELEVADVESKQGRVAQNSVEPTARRQVGLPTEEQKNEADKAKLVIIAEMETKISRLQLDKENLIEYQRQYLQQEQDTKKENDYNLTQVERGLKAERELARVCRFIRMLTLKRYCRMVAAKKVSNRLVEELQRVERRILNDPLATETILEKDEWNAKLDSANEALLPPPERHYHHSGAKKAAREKKTYHRLDDFFNSVETLKYATNQIAVALYKFEDVKQSSSQSMYQLMHESKDLNEKVKEKERQMRYSALTNRVSLLYFILHAPFEVYEPV
jgi:hypothetical protein